MVRTYDDFGYGFPPVQLFDMETDPHQTRNIAPAEPDTVARCTLMMDEWVDARRAPDGWPPDPLMTVLRERGTPAPA